MWALRRLLHNASNGSASHSNGRPGARCDSVAVPSLDEAQIGRGGAQLWGLGPTVPSAMGDLAQRDDKAGVFRNWRFSGGMA